MPLATIRPFSRALSHSAPSARAFSTSFPSFHCGCGRSDPHVHSPSDLSLSQVSTPKLVTARSNPFLPPTPRGALLPPSLRAASIHSTAPVRAEAPPTPAFARTPKTPEQLLESNKKWAASLKTSMPGFLDELDKQQSPEYLWIGCSDSRVPANTLVDLLPGEVFVHRNIANVVNNQDMSALSVLEFSIDVLKVKHIMVVGHYGCGGVLAAMGNRQFGLLDNWLRSIKDLYKINRAQLESITDMKARGDALVELNVNRSVDNVCHTSIVQNAWRRGQELHVHGWCYRVSDGLLKDLKITHSGDDRLEEVFKTA